jgi:hypothetical protein
MKMAQVANKRCNIAKEEKFQIYKEKDTQLNEMY